ncbi:Cytochrome c-type biogenesis protein CcmH/NrfG [Mariniphaga anaerophila]|uniref:Cytochrome c-type biogenesis protein CcmH/NrfG n=1 Tax=Mariniphaga anaerophila TaxID=1484053 RepID=A0A1M4VYK9_9BACT|nr:tetratricopeptide repeat protein [Mariniphaga anaerophila]SHE73953.1 Cytochrome c-type biogenesis protein CcmH/NrfG [Mariniphaga anaerophila]
MNRNKKKFDKKKTNKPGAPNKKWLWGGVVLAVFTFLLFSPSLKYDFVNWDDDVNIYENKNVTDLNIKGIFTEHVIGNYNPLSNLTFALEYQLVGDKPFLYHFNNLLLHVLCTLLVFLLMRKMGLSFLVSFLVALLFGIHPMRIESVVWVTERKDVLFGTFFLLSLLFYTTYLEKRRSLFYVLSLGAFTLSLLSKIQAVALAPTLLLIDYWFSRKIDRKLILEKVPYFILALITGVAGIWFLKQQGSLHSGTHFPLLQRLFIGSYSFVIYLIKSVVPWEMSAAYPYPEQISTVFYLSMIPAIAVVAIPLSRFKKNKNLTFGILFFLFNIAFLLQVVGAGQGFLADRFTYIPYIGLFLILAKLVEGATEKYSTKRSFVYTIVVVYLVLLATVTFNQMKVWQNSETLWTDVIEKYPNTPLPYNNLGHYLRQQNQPERALENYNRAIQLAPEKAQPYNNRGKIYFDRGEMDKALADYNKCIEIEPNNVSALANRGAALGSTRQWKKALKDLNKALQLNPQHSNALSNRAFIWFQEGEYEKSIADFNRYLVIHPNNAEVINTIGLCHFRMKNNEKALEEFNRSIRIDPSKGVFFANRSLALNALGDKTNALKDAERAIQLGVNVNQNYLNYLKQ